MSGFPEDDYNPFRPVWEDNEEEKGLDLPPSLQYRKPTTELSLSDPELLRGLLETEQTLSRLDATVSASPPSIREGLIARMAFREASGWLAQASQWVHPNDVALRSLGLTGSYIASAKAGTLKRDLPNTLSETSFAEDENTVVGDRTVALALALAKILTHLPKNALENADTVQNALVPLGWVVDDLKTVQVVDWLLDYREDTKKLPTIVAALYAAAVWRSIDDGVEDEVDLRAGFLLTCAMSERLRTIPLPFWTARPIVYGLQKSASPFGKERVVGQLKLINESGLSAMRELERLTDFQKRFTDLTTRLTKRSRMSDAIDAAIRLPIVTPQTLSRRLKITPQASTKLLRHLSDIALMTESTGRKSFRGFTIK